MRTPLDLPQPPLGDPALGIELRAWGAGDADADRLAAAWADPDVARWTAVPERRDRQAAARWIEGERERRARGLALDLVVSGAVDRSVVHGEVGLVVVDPDRGWAEVGFWLFAEARGRGRATRALDLLATWALEATPLRRLYARTVTANPAAGGVLAGSGFRLAGEAGPGVQVWVRDRPAGTAEGRG